eukprot:1113059-Ditylum_brightwellii.AAC.1
MAVSLPQNGRALGLEIRKCDYYLLPSITKSKAGFPFHKHLPSDYGNNTWILSINNIEPHSAESAVHL